MKMNVLHLMDAQMKIPSNVTKLVHVLRPMTNVKKFIKILNFLTDVP